MEHIGEAFSLFRRHPRLWQYVWGPVAMALGLLSVLLALGWRWIQAWSPSQSDEVSMLFKAFFIFAVVVFFAWIFFAIVALLGSLVWERLTAEVERLLGVTYEGKPVGCAGSAIDTSQRLGFTAVMTVLGLVVGSFLPGVGALVVAGIIGLFDFTASAYLRRGITLPGQFSRVFQLKGWTTFTLGAGFLSLIPFVNVLALPLLVAGGTIMVVRTPPSGLAAPQ